MILSLRKNILLSLSILWIGIPLNGLPCTVFSIKQKNQIVVAKNLDWPIGDGIIFINKKGVKKFAHVLSQNKLEWVSKYGSITFNQFGKEFPLGGMNEKGLVIEELNNWGKTPESDSLFKLNEFQIVQYVLDNFSSTNELDSLKNIILEPLFINLHYFITDKNGNRAILEYYDGNMFLYQESEIPYPVLSNNHYSNSLKYMKFFKPFGGEQDIPDSKSSNDRFLKTAINLANMKKEKTDDIDLKAFDFLDDVKQNDTQWSIVYDIENMKIYFRTKQNQKIRDITFDQFDYSCETKDLCYKLNVSDENNINNKFILFTPELNRNLVLNVYNKYKELKLGEVEKEIFVGLYEFGNNTRCK